MKHPNFILFIFLITLLSCSDDENETTSVTASSADNNASLHAAFNEFDSGNFTITKDADKVTLVTTGLPNHKSPYWSNTKTRSISGPNGQDVTGPAATNHPLWVEATVADENNMAPGNIDDFNGSYSLTVSANPTKATTTSATGLGAIGFAISGSVIYNDEEGPGIPLSNAAGGLDFNGAHTGPQSYHYHLEPVSFSSNDSNLIGIISDGFFIYGRKCASVGSYPSDLDVSGGHVSTTQHTTTAEYHYHLQNSITNINGTGYYILFPGDYQGTPNAIR